MTKKPTTTERNCNDSVFTHARFEMSVSMKAGHRSDNYNKDGKQVEMTDIEMTSSATDAQLELKENKHTDVIDAETDEQQQDTVSDNDVTLIYSKLKKSIMLLFLLSRIYLRSWHSIYFVYLLRQGIYIYCLYQCDDQSIFDALWCFIFIIYMYL